MLVQWPEVFKIAFVVHWPRYSMVNGNTARPIIFFIYLSITHIRVIAAFIIIL